MTILIKNAHIIDPANKINKKGDLLIAKGKIEKLADKITAKAEEIIDAKGQIVVPGLIDLHTHLRQPGREDAEDFKTGSQAAAKGGFTSITAMPNTSPACDNRSAVEYVISEARRAACVNVFCVGAITMQQQGNELTEMADMKEAGAVAISDDGSSVKNAQVLRKAFEYAAMLDLPVLSHCEDKQLSQNGVMNEGFVSTLLGMRGIPNISESAIVSRDIALAALTNVRLHIVHVSCAESVRIIKHAKAEGAKITAETCPHYFSLTDEAVKTFNTNTKVNPPLRAESDKNAIIEAIKHGIIDVIATDHAPHTEADKDVEYDIAAFGMIGLETALSLAINELVDKKIITWDELITKMSYMPARILGLNKKGRLSPGADADIVIIDPDKKWIFGKQTIVSKSKNSPFIGREFKGAAATTICSGKIVYSNK